MARRTITATTSAEIPAPATVIYDLIADYLNEHPRILPPEHFTFLAVDSGGWGAGIRIRFGMKAFGRVTTSHGAVCEPVPCRELRGTLEDGLVTTFLVEPRGSGLTRVTIETVYQRSGLRAFIERLVVPSFLRKVYDAELDLLSCEATGAGSTRSSTA